MSDDYEENYKPRLGIIGGAGPDAGVDFLQRVLRKNREALAERYQSDRDAPDAVLFQVSDIGGPRGEGDLFDEEGAPYQKVWGGLQTTIREILRLKLNRFCIVCNTLHVLEPRVLECIDAEAEEMQIDSKPKFVSIVSCTLSEIYRLERKRKSPGEDVDRMRVAVLGSRNVTDPGSSPYRDVANVVLTDAQRCALQELLSKIKVSVPPDRDDNVSALLSLMDGLEADVYVLACTELPLLLPRLTIAPSKVVLDPSELLAAELINGW